MFQCFLKFIVSEWFLRIDRDTEIFPHFLGTSSRSLLLIEFTEVSSPFLLFLPPFPFSFLLLLLPCLPLSPFLHLPIPMKTVTAAVFHYFNKYVSASRSYPTLFLCTLWFSQPFTMSPCLLECPILSKPLRIFFQHSD